MSGAGGWKDTKKRELERRGCKRQKSTHYAVKIIMWSALVSHTSNTRLFKLLLDLEDKCWGQRWIIHIDERVAPPETHMSLSLFRGRTQIGCTRMSGRVGGIGPVSASMMIFHHGVWPCRRATEAWIQIHFSRVFDWKPPVDQECLLKDDYLTDGVLLIYLSVVSCKES